MRRSFVIVFFAFAMQIAVLEGWKPISAPATSFSIRQSHPAIGSSSHSRNSIGGDTSGGSVADRSFSISEDHRIASEAALLEGSDEASEYRGINTVAGSYLDSTGTGFPEDACSVDKYAFDHHGTVHFRNKLPKMDQFTICFWMRFTNHTGDHTILTYSVDDEPREIQIWIANSKGSSYISLAIHGQSLYRLNYPLKMRTWHHTCTSWNGKTGEWQLWMKTERVGRGFHNRLVNHVIPGHGVLFSGGPSITGPVANGLHFEMTLLQIYKVALTAGKAHRDHKHHHVHHFDHDGPVTTTAAPPMIRPPNQFQLMNPLLANGQIPTRVRINLAVPQPPVAPTDEGLSIHGVPSQVLGGILPATPRPLTQATISTNFVNGQFNTGGRFISQQLLSNSFPQSQSRQLQSSPITFPGEQLQAVQFPTNIQLVDSTDSNSRLFKRDIDPKTASKIVKKRETPKEISRNDKKLNKRGLIMLGDGTVIDDTLLAHGYQFEGLAQFGLPAFQENLKNRMNIEEEIKEHDKEPAEDEVAAVMNLCTSCDEEPFKGAIALAWRSVVPSLGDAIKGRSVGGCGYF